MMGKCSAVRPYPDVHRLAALTVEEMAFFEQKIAQLAVRGYCEFKTISLLIHLAIMNTDKR